MSTNKKQVEQLNTFLENHHVATLATVSKDSKPHAATIYYFMNYNSDICFFTKNETAKYKNLQEDNNIALVISDTESLQTIQIEGIAQEIINQAEMIRTTDNLAVDNLKNIGAWKEIPIEQIKKGDLAVFKIRPTWIRWTDFKDKNNIVLYEK